MFSYENWLHCLCSINLQVNIIERVENYWFYSWSGKGTYKLYRCESDIPHWKGRITWIHFQSLWYQIKMRLRRLWKMEIRTRDSICITNIKIQSYIWGEGQRRRFGPSQREMWLSIIIWPIKHNFFAFCFKQKSIKDYSIRLRWLNYRQTRNWI